MIMYEEPLTEDEAKSTLADICSEAEVVMYPATRNEGYELKPKRKVVTAYFQRLIATCYRKGWKALGKEAAVTMKKLNVTKESVQAIETIW